MIKKAEFSRTAEGRHSSLPGMAYFSVQYCALCAVLMEKCAVLRFEMFCLQSTKANGIRTLFEAAGKICNVTWFYVI